MLMVTGTASLIRVLSIGPCGQINAAPIAFSGDF